MANINTSPTPVLNSDIEGYPNATSGQLSTADINQLIAAQTNYQATLQATGGDPNDPAALAALNNFQAVQGAQTAANLAGRAAKALGYSNLAGVIGTGSNLFSQVTNARNQQVFSEQRRSVNSLDWRVKISLAPEADYLYKDPTILQSDLLFPLKVTNGVVFPYTPSISTNYSANYSPVPLTHSNMTNYFYQGSSVGAMQITGTFTAQDTAEADYLLAVIHFFKSATKMFYGQDALAGAPPPLLYLSGFGLNQFNNHPVLMQTFTYSTPTDVDFIRAGSVNQSGASLLTRRSKNSLPNDSFSSTIRRLQTFGQLLGLVKGANPTQIAQSQQGNQLGGDRPTYVPTKVDLSITVLPVQTRQQTSKQFSLKGFANGNLLRGGFW